MMTHLPFCPVLSCFSQSCISNCFCCFFKWCLGYSLFSTPHTFLAQMKAIPWLLPQSPLSYSDPGSSTGIMGLATSWTLARLTKQTGHELYRVPPGPGPEPNRPRTLAGLLEFGETQESKSLKHTLYSDIL